MISYHQHEFKNKLVTNLKLPVREVNILIINFINLSYQENKLVLSTHGKSTYPT
jgi:hypothetical protein